MCADPLHGAACAGTIAGMNAGTGDHSLASFAFPFFPTFAE